MLLLVLKIILVRAQMVANCTMQMPYVHELHCEKWQTSHPLITGLIQKSERLALNFHV